VGLLLFEQPNNIVVPDSPPGIYRIQDTVVVGSTEFHVYSLVELSTSD
jgi:hypothetical protein